MGKLFDTLMGMDKAEGKREDIVKAPFMWAGGKSKSLDKILEKLPYTDRYVEVFGGSGAVLLARGKSKLEVFNDKYSGVTDFYQVIRDPELFQQLVDRLELSIHSREDWRISKDEWVTTEDPVERAAKWYTSVIYSFSSLGRNFGRATAPASILAGKIQKKLTMFNGLHDRLKKVTIENQDWRRILKDFDHPDTVFYLDPPYITAHRGTYKHELDMADHKELLDTIFTLDGFVAYSGYEHEMVDELPWDDKFEWQATVTVKPGIIREENNRNINHDDTGRTTAKECLWIKEAR